jgi:hypothetical protein
MGVMVTVTAVSEVKLIDDTELSQVKLRGINTGVEYCIWFLSGAVTVIVEPGWSATSKLPLPTVMDSIVAPETSTVMPLTLKTTLEPSVTSLKLAASASAGARRSVREPESRIFFMGVRYELINRYKRTV